MKKNFLKVIAAVALLAVSLAFVGCGDDDGGGSTTQPAALLPLPDGVYTVATLTATNAVELTALTGTTFNIALSGTDVKIEVGTDIATIPVATKDWDLVKDLLDELVTDGDAFTVAAKKLTVIETAASGAAADLSGIPVRLFGATLNVTAGASAAITLPALTTDLTVVSGTVTVGNVTGNVEITAGTVTLGDVTGSLEITAGTLTVGTVPSIIVKGTGVAITATAATTVDISALVDTETVDLAGAFAFTVTAKATGAGVYVYTSGTGTFAEATASTGDLTYVLSNAGTLGSVTGGTPSASSLGTITPTATGDDATITITVTAL